MANVNKFKDDSSDLLNYVRVLFKHRKVIVKISVVFFLIGLFLVVFSKNTYIASTTIVPQTSSKSNIAGNLGGIAALAGVDLSSMGGESGITPQLYPQVLNSISLQKELLETPIIFSENGEKMSYKYYYTNVYKLGFLETLKKYTLGLPSVLLTAIKGEKNEPIQKKDSIVRITKKEKKLIKQIQKQLHLQVNKKEGYVKLSTEMPNALAAAQFTKLAQDLLQSYIISFKIQESKSQLEFIKERYLEKEKEFKAVQKKYAIFKDSNQSINSALGQTQLVLLQSEYDLSSTMYAELAKQLEKQLLQVKQDTPVFTVIEPVSVPIERSGISRILILLVWGFFGFMFGVAFVFFKLYFTKLKSEF